LSINVSTALALARAIPSAEFVLAGLRSATYQSLRCLPACETVVFPSRGPRITLTTYVDVLDAQDQSVKVAVQLIAHGWLGYRRHWIQGFMATKSGMRRGLRRRERLEYTWRERPETRQAGV
jgi:hypothetical protein